VGSPLIELRRVTLQFQGTAALFENLDWQLPDPFWAALVGPSGSGKTSLIHLIAGLERPSRGEVLVAGSELGKLNDQELSRHRQTVVGTAFQHFHLQTERTALDNLLLPLFFSGADLKVGRERAGRFCAELDLGHLLDAPVRQLSGGQRQRLALARALMNEPRILLADEPIGNLDMVSAQRVLGLLQKERERGMSMLVVTHDDFILQGITEIFRLENGQLS
jgi:putative ABC transport system ATP-binding protein